MVTMPSSLLATKLYLPVQPSRFVPRQHLLPAPSAWVKPETAPDIDLCACRLWQDHAYCGMDPQ